MTTIGECTEMSLRIKAINAGINLDDLTPCGARLDFSKKSGIEADMYENGFTVEDLKNVQVDEEKVKKEYARKRERRMADLKRMAIKDGIDLDDLDTSRINYKDRSTKGYIQAIMISKRISVQDLKNINLDDEMEKRKKESEGNSFNVFTLMTWIRENRHLLPPKEEEKKHPYHRYKDAIDSHLNKEMVGPKKPGDEKAALDKLIVRHGLQDKLKDDPFRYKKIIDYHWKYIKGSDEVTLFDDGVFESPIGPPPLDDDAVPEFLQALNKRMQRIGESNKDQKTDYPEDDHIVDD